MVNLELTPEEIQSLGRLINTAVQAGGIEAAKVALPIYAKLETAVANANAAPQETV
jgi:glycine cleavage system H lipoate-binding protein